MVIVSGFGGHSYYGDAPGAGQSKFRLGCTFDNGIRQSGAGSYRGNFFGQDGNSIPCP